MKSMSSNHRPFARGFTLIEILAILGIIGALALLIVPLVSRSIQSAQSAKCKSNLRQWGVALTQYLNDEKNQLMPGEGMEGGGLNLSDPNAWFNKLPRLINMKTLKELCESGQAPSPVSGENADQTIFSCPSFRKEDLDGDEGDAFNPVFSYAYNLFCDHPTRSKEIPNTKYPDGRLPFYMVPDPTRFVVFGEVAIVGFDNMSAIHQVFRHRGGDMINLCFADGHVGSFHKDEVYVDVSETKFKNRGVMYNPDAPVDN